MTVYKATKVTITSKDGVVTELDPKGFEWSGDVELESPNHVPAFPPPRTYSASVEMKLDRKAFDELITFLDHLAPLPPITSRSQALREARHCWSRCLPLHRKGIRFSVPKRWATVFIREYTRCREQRLHYLGQRFGMIRKEGAK